MYVNKRMSSRGKVSGTLPAGGSVYLKVPLEAQQPFTVQATGSVYVAFDDAGTDLFGVPVQLGTQDGLGVTPIKNNAKVIAIFGVAGDPYTVLF